MFYREVDLYNQDEPRYISPRVPPSMQERDRLRGVGLRKGLFKNSKRSSSRAEVVCSTPDALSLVVILCPVALSYCMSESVTLVADYHRLCEESLQP